MNSRRTFLSGIPLAALGAAAATTASATVMGGPEAIKSIEEIKKRNPNGTEWREAEFAGRKLLFCLAVRPSFGESFIDVLGWAYREHLEGWQPVLDVKTHKVGALTWDIDVVKGIFSVRGSAENELKGVEVVRFDLRVA